MQLEETPKTEIDSVIALYSVGKFDEAIEVALQLTKSYPADSLLFNITGACYTSLGQLGSALDYYEKSISINPNYSKAHFNLGNTLYDLAHQGFVHLEKPIKSYQKSIEIDPNYAEAHNNLGNVLNELDRTQEAIDSFNKAININPDYVEAHYSLGTALFDLGEFKNAIKAYQKAVKINPVFAEAYNNLGNAYLELDKHNDSVECYQKAIKINPNYSEAYNNLGNTFKELGKHKDSVECYQKALEINPDYPALHNNLGNAYKELGKLEDALSSYSKGLSINSGYVDLLNNLGVTLSELSRLDEAIDAYEKAISINPDYAEAFNNLGVALNKLGKHEEAVKSYEKALKVEPEYADAYNNLGVVLKKLGRTNEAIKSYEKALNINQDDADTHNNLGIALDEVGRLDDAIKSYQKAIFIQPDMAEAYNNYGHILCKLHKYHEAAKSYEKVLVIKPNLAYVLGNLLNAKMNLCDWNGLDSLLNDAKAQIKNNQKVIEPFNLMALIDEPKLQKQAQELRIFSDHPRSSVLPMIKKYPKHSKIRIGYFSADFRIHPVAYLTAELYELHDRDQFEIHAFSFGLDTKDELNLRIKAGVDHFHDVDLLSFKETALLSRSLEIDIAIDLGGFTAESRTDIFAMSAAPIQLSYIGYLGTMGADYYDYLIADSIMIPKDSQRFYSEKIAYLPNFQVNDSSESPPEIKLSRKDLGLPDKGFIFCCFNNTYKFTPQIFDSWAKILHQVEGSVLIVFANNELSKTNLSKEIVNRGVDSNRLIFGDSLSRPEYLARYKSADLFLDTHPYNAGTTASDALRMGLPMLTYVGNSYQSRMGASIVSALNLPELVANHIEEYEKIAIDLAKNPDKLKVIKDKLLKNLSTAPLYDTKRFTKNIEAAYSEMYERYQKGLKPDHIYVED